jgi:hypothetical protein
MFSHTVLLSLQCVELLRKALCSEGGGLVASASMCGSMIHAGHFYRTIANPMAGIQNRIGRSSSMKSGAHSPWDFLSCVWCPGWDLNPHSRCRKKDFKSFASADSATRACLWVHSIVIRPERADRIFHNIESAVVACVSLNARRRRTGDFGVGPRLEERGSQGLLPRYRCVSL